MINWADVRAGATMASGAAPVAIGLSLLFQSGPTSKLDRRTANVVAWVAAVLAFVVGGLDGRFNAIPSLVPLRSVLAWTEDLPVASSAASSRSRWERSSATEAPNRRAPAASRRSTSFDISEERFWPWIAVLCLAPALLTCPTISPDRERGWIAGSLVAVGLFAWLWTAQDVLAWLALFGGAGAAASALAAGWGGSERARAAPQFAARVGVIGCFVAFAWLTALAAIPDLRRLAAARVEPPSTRFSALLQQLPDYAARSESTGLYWTETSSGLFLALAAASFLLISAPPLHVGPLRFLSNAPPGVVALICVGWHPLSLWWITQFAGAWLPHQFSAWTWSVACGTSLAVVYGGLQMLAHRPAPRVMAAGLLAMVWSMGGSQFLAVAARSPASMEQMLAPLIWLALAWLAWGRLAARTEEAEWPALRGLAWKQPRAALLWGGSLLGATAAASAGWWESHRLLRSHMSQSPWMFGMLLEAGWMIAVWAAVWLVETTLFGRSRPQEAQPSPAHGILNIEAKPASATIADTIRDEESIESWLPLLPLTALAVYLTCAPLLR